MVQIYILTYNRSDLVISAIDSALKQDYQNFEVVISDNSTNSQTKSAIIGKYANIKNLKYIKREPSVPWHDHFNLILSEVTADYFMMFHDDDIMYPNMLSELFKIIDNDSTIAAVGGNANIVRFGRRRGAMHKQIKGITSFKTGSELVTPYLTEVGCIPFPSYLYNKKFVQGVDFNLNDGGKYCDVSFLMALCKNGKICWVNTPLMDYFIHQNQVSAFDVFEDRLKLIKYIVNTTACKLSDPQMKEFRMINIYGEIKNRLFDEKRSVSVKRYLKFLFIALKCSPKRIFPRLVYFFPKLVLKY